MTSLSLPCSYKKESLLRIESTHIEFSKDLNRCLPSNSFHPVDGEKRYAIEKSASALRQVVMCLEMAVSSPPPVGNPLPGRRSAASGPSSRQPLEAGSVTTYTLPFTPYHRAFSSVAGFGGPKLTWLRQKASSLKARLARRPSRSARSRPAALPKPIIISVPRPHCWKGSASKPYVELPPHTAPLGMEVGPAQACAVKKAFLARSTIGRQGKAVASEGFRGSFPGGIAFFESQSSKKEGRISFQAVFKHDMNSSNAIKKKNGRRPHTKKEKARDELLTSLDLCVSISTIRRGTKTLDHRLGSLEIDGYALARMQTLACPYYLRTLAMRSHLSDLGSEACRKEERERAEKRVLRQQFFLVPTKSVFPYSFLALSLVQIGHVLTRSFFKIFEPLKDAVGILLTELALSYPMGNFRVHPLAAQAVQYFLSSILLKGPAIEYTLDLGNHNLNGPIPENLADLAQLQCLVLSHNNLSGSIPSKSSLSFSQVNIPDLSYAQHRGVFDLSYNRSLSRLTNLTTLDLSGNLLTGLIPPEFGDSLKLQGLYLGKNQLSGTIPERLGRLSSLVKLNLTSNKNFSGPVPTSFGNLKGLTHLDLSSNELSGELPSSLASIINLVGLYVQQNGTVEEAVTEQAVTESAAIEPPSVGRRTTGSGSSYLISSGHWASSSFPSFSSFSSQGSKLNLKEKGIA
ncbi:hypothetical protein L1987_88824 [Smallanthus sonchifolius]|nr:hypothetical protein L1987_88824 [Smallanthus sonchifolius]